MRTQSNSKLRKARRVKDNEFYTQIVDIEKELAHYKDQFKGKVVYCNCDSENSNFVKYFSFNFETLGLGGLVYTSDDFNNHLDLLEQADIVVTNPPYSLLSEFFALMYRHNKQFIIIGNAGAVAYRDVFPLIKENKLWLGYNTVRWFERPDGTLKEGAKSYWYTNITNGRYNEPITLTHTYTPELYPHYDNYDAIEVSKTADIPMDYEGVMGVPISFLERYNPQQFEILDLNPYFYNLEKCDKPRQLTLQKCGRKDPYSRVLIKKVVEKTD